MEAHSRVRGCGRRKKLVRVGSGKGYDKLVVVEPCSVITSTGLQL